MASYSQAIKRVIEQFTTLPGIGPKTAERLTYFLLTRTKEEIDEFAQALAEIKAKIIRCGECQNFSETNPCDICRDPRRTAAIICVVAKPQDVIALEKIGDFEGRYHVLGGVIDPVEGVTPEKIRIRELVERLKREPPSEVILALNPDMSGETTSMYLISILKQFRGTKITRLARGLPIGSDLEYADEVTLSNALGGRREV